MEQEITKHENMASSAEARPIHSSGKNWFDKYYKLMMIPPILLLILSLVYIGFFYANTGEFLLRDVSLAGGTTITLNVAANSSIDFENFEFELKQQASDVSLRKLTDMRTGAPIAIIIESSSTPEVLTPQIESLIGYALDEQNSSTEFSGSSLGENFYKQLILALIISFVLMSIVIFLLFRTFIPSLAVIFAAFADIVMPLALLNYLGVKLSAAGIAAFLMLLGYSVDTDILLTTRAIKNREGRLNERLFRAFKTGTFMTITALLAVIPAFFLVTGLPDSFRQIFLILALGLLADLFNTWLTNMGIIKWYCEKHSID